MKHQHICLCFTSKTFAGLERFICSYANWLVDRGIKTSVALSTPTLLNGHIDNRVHVIKGFTWCEEPITLESVMQAKKLFRSINASQIVFNHVGMLTFCSSVIGARIAGNVSIIQFYHNIVRAGPSFGQIGFFPLNLWWLRPFIRFRITSFLSRKLIFNNQVSLKNTKRLFRVRSSKLELLHLGVDIGKFKPNEVQASITRQLIDLNDDVFLVGTLCRLNGRKGERELLHGMAKFLKLVPEAIVKCVFVGDGEKKSDFESLAKSLGLSDIVDFVGYIDSPENYLNAFDVFVSLTEDEAFGLALLEAMACGKPCIAAKAGGLASVLSEEDGFIGIENKFAKQLSIELEKFYIDKQKRRKYGTLARKTAVSKYSQEDCWKIFTKVCFGSLIEEITGV